MEAIVNAYSDLPVLRGRGELDLHGGKSAFGLAQLALESELACCGLLYEARRQNKQPPVARSRLAAARGARPPGPGGFRRAPSRAAPLPSVADSPNAVDWQRLRTPTVPFEWPRVPPTIRD